MLRRLPFRRALVHGPVAVADAAVEPLLREAAGSEPAVEETTTNPPAGALAPPAHRSLVTRRRIALAIVLAAAAGLGIAYQQKDRWSAQAADLSRSVIGDENTARVESWYFRIQDRVDQVKYRVLGGTTNPFVGDEVRIEYLVRAAPRTIVYFADSGRRATEPVLVADTLGVAPMQLPKTTALRDTLESGEGVWTTVGLPRSNPNDILMAKTFVRPDKARPYALVGVLCVDSRRVRLHLRGGTGDPGGFRGVKGPGAIPQSDYANLLTAWNGGFKGPHGGFGMYADGRTYVPLRNGLASIAVFKDGTIKMGEWGKDLTWDENMVGVRQNAVLLVQNGEVSRRVSEGNDTWGYVAVNSAEFITWRSAVGLTKEGNLLVATGNSLSAETLAKALWAAGAYIAMQLDINNPYVLAANYFPQADGTLRSERFMDTMPDPPSRFLRSQERDFMYLTLDESRYRN